MTQPAGATSCPPNSFDRIIGAMSAVPVALIVAVIFADVFARYAFSTPIRGSVEIVEYAMALAIFTALPLVTRNRGHVSVCLVDGLLGAAANRLKTLVSDVISTAVLGVMTWRLWLQADDDFAHGTRTVVLGWPHAPLYYAMAVLAAVTTFCMLWLTWRSLRSVALGESA